MMFTETLTVKNPTISVSVIVMNYNYERYLKVAIESCLQQTYPNVEVIVVDDGSTDNSKDIINGFGSKIVPVFKKNGGQASALNAGFNASKGQIICLLDADDLYIPERIQYIVDIFQADLEIDWVFTESAPVETEELLAEKLPSVYQKIWDAPDESTLTKIDFRHNIENGEIPGFTPSTSNLCFSRKILEKIFPLPEIKGVSGMAITDLYMKSLAAGLGKGYKTTKELGIYRFHDNYYNSLDVDKKRRMFGEIYTTTGYWMKKRFTGFEKVSKKFVSKGFATYLSSSYKKDLVTDADCRQMYTDYSSDMNILRRLSVYLLTLLYWGKLRFQNFV